MTVCNDNRNPVGIELVEIYNYDSDDEEEKEDKGKEYASDLMFHSPQGNKPRMTWIALV